MENSIANMRPHLVNEWSERNLPLSPNDVPYGSNKLYWWNGPCGHEWETSAKARSAGEKCPICSGARVIAGVNDLNTTCPSLAEEWSSKNKIKPTEVSAGSHKKVLWHGKCGHEWTAEVKSRVNGTGCPYCSHNIVLPGFNDLASRFPKLAAEWSERNYPLYPNMVTAFKNKKVWWKCSLGHEWYTLISTRAGGSQCPYCSGSLAHTKWNCKYHIVFAPKYRRQVIYGKIKADIGIMLRKLCEYKQVEILEAEACKDQIHMLVSIPPKYSVSQIMGYLKGKSSLMIFEKYANMKYKYGNRHFWCRGYYVDTVGRNKKAIAEHIRNQLQEDISYDQMSLVEYVDPFTGKQVKEGK